MTKANRPAARRASAASRAAHRSNVQWAAAVAGTRTGEVFHGPSASEQSSLTLGYGGITDFVLDLLPDTYTLSLTDTVTPDGGTPTAFDSQIQLTGTLRNYVPEPASFGLVGIGLIGLAGLRRRR